VVVLVAVMEVVEEEVVVDVVVVAELTSLKVHPEEDDLEVTCILLAGFAELLTITHHVPGRFDDDLQVDVDLLVGHLPQHVLLALDVIDFERGEVQLAKSNRRPVANFNTYYSNRYPQVCYLRF